MTSLWPWLAVAGVGALHGLNPATGWALAAASGVRARNPAQALRALAPIATGHTASVALVAFTVMASVQLGLALDIRVLQAAAGALLVAVALMHWRRRSRCGDHPQAQRTPATPAGTGLANTGFASAGLALWSFIMSTAHGAGLMLVPALVPLCLAGTPAREITASGSMLMALAAVAVHSVAMLVVTGVAAWSVCRGVDAGARHFPRTARRARARPFT